MTKQNNKKKLSIILIILLIFSFVPFNALAEEETITYTNSDLHAEVDIPQSALNSIVNKGANGIMIPINTSITINVTYGDLFESYYKDAITWQEKNNKALKEAGKEQLTVVKPKKEDLYLECEYFADTWNNEEYMRSYFNEIFNSSDYNYTITKDTLSGMPAWKCEYSGTVIQGGGYYWFTIFNGVQYTFNTDIFLSNYTSYNEYATSIYETYVIDGSENYSQTVGGADVTSKLNDKDDAPYKVKDLVVVVTIIVVFALGIYLTIKQGVFKNAKNKKAAYRKKRQQELKNSKKNNSNKNSSNNRRKRK